jgi:uncharacterized BrkB/YihY/UPF0761 family membrane protein
MDIKKMFQNYVGIASLGFMLFGILAAILLIPVFIIFSPIFYIIGFIFEAIYSKPGEEDWDIFGNDSSIPDYEHTQQL